MEHIANNIDTAKVHNNNNININNNLNNNNIVIITTSSIPNDSSSSKSGLVLPPSTNNNNNISSSVGSTTTTTTTYNTPSSSSPPNNFDKSSSNKINHSQFVDIENHHIINNTDVGNNHFSTNTTTTTTFSSFSSNNNNNNNNNDFVSDEIIVDGVREWVPIHLLRKTKAKFWTHYLGLDKHLYLLKCKHCGEILQKFVSSSSNSNGSLQTTKKLQKHLKKIHRLDPLVSYYADKPVFLTQSNLLLNNNNNKSNNNPDFITSYNNYFDPNNIHSDHHHPPPPPPPTTTTTTRRPLDSDFIDSNTTLHLSNFKNIHPSIQQRLDSFPISKLMAIIIASQNLSINFINDPTMKLIYSKLSTPFYPNQNSVKSTIRFISNQINNIVKRTTNRNNSNLHFIIDIHTLPSDLLERSNFLTDRLNFFLNEINNITLLSLTSNVTNPNSNTEAPLYPINILSLQYFDSHNNCSKIIPLTLKVSESNLSNTVTTLRNLLLDTYHQFPNLYKSVLSLTVPHTDPNHHITNNDLHFSDLPLRHDIPTHFCIVSILSEILKPIFIDNDSNSTDINGHIDDSKCPKPSNYYSNDPNQHFLDACVDLSKVHISNTTQSIFNRIKQFYNELNSNPWQLERFNQVYKDTFNNTHRPPLLQQFDTHFYSTAQSTLQTFLDLKPVILNVQNSLQCENFKEADFLVISTLLDLIGSINRLILFFGTSNRLNFVYIIFAILSIEKQLTELIGHCKVQSLVAVFKRIQNVVKRHKRSLLDDQMNLLALFCCPATLFDRDVLEHVFKTVSLSEIVNKVSKIIRDIIKRFITIEFVSNSNNNKNNGNNNDNRQPSTDPDLLNGNYNDINNVNRRFFNGNENRIIETEIDSILEHIINEDLYDYLSTVNTVVPLSYKAYCERTGYIRDEGRFKKIIENSNDVETMTEVDQLLDIHIPVCTAFWDKYLANDAGKIVRLLLKIMATESSTSKRIEYAFLNGFISKLGDDYLEDVVKIRLFNEQFPIGKVDYDVDTLATITQYD